MLKCANCGNEVKNKRAKKFCSAKCHNEFGKESLRLRNVLGRKYHEIVEDHGTWVVLDISTNAHPDATMKIDKINYDLFSFGVFMDKKGYCTKIIDGKSTKVHRAICPDDWNMVDHINRDKSDNRVCNLRKTDPVRNALNSKLNKNNRSGQAGVYFKKTQKCWDAYINENGKRKYLGSFKRKQDAVEARRSAEISVYGELVHQEINND